jgi:hypothetical protein
MAAWLQLARAAADRKLRRIGQRRLRDPVHDPFRQRSGGEISLSAQRSRWLHAFPGTGTSAEIEEERRLLYLAMTGVKDDLHLIVPQRFFVHGQHAQGDRHLYASRTRFIPEKMLGLFERTAWPVVPAGIAARATGQGPKVDSAAARAGCGGSREMAPTILALHRNRSDDRRRYMSAIAPKRVSEKPDAIKCSVVIAAFAFAVHQSPYRYC